MKKISIVILRIYKKIVSPALETIFGRACRFTPTCSEYSLEAIKKYGFIKGLMLAMRRISRCHPLTRPAFDPVP